MVYLLYGIAAFFVVWLSGKASDYVNQLDKKTKLSGAFIGGIMLSAVTSLPELFTSISSTLMLDKPGLCMGNILGSDLFNTAMLSVMILIAGHTFGEAKLAGCHKTIAIAVLFIYIIIFSNMVGLLDINLLTVSVTSWIIIGCYLISVRHMSQENGEETRCEDAAGISNLSVFQIGVRFVMVSLGIIVVSIIITYLTDNIAGRLHLGSGLAGALFLGIATSLPETASTIALFRIGNYDIAVGNIIGSNLFNFLILAVVDVFYIGNGIYDFTDPQTVNLLVFGTVAALLCFVMLLLRNKITRLICPVGIVACYVAFLVV